MRAVSSHSDTGVGAARGITTTASEAGLSPLLFCALRVRKRSLELGLLLET
jgi:hypothetical protein